jgi:hypothetical protein
MATVMAKATAQTIVDGCPIEHRDAHYGVATA